MWPCFYTQIDLTMLWFYAKIALKQFWVFHTGSIVCVELFRTLKLFLGHQWPNRKNQELRLVGSMGGMPPEPPEKNTLKLQMPLGSIKVNWICLFNSGKTQMYDDMYDSSPRHPISQSFKLSLWPYLIGEVSGWNLLSMDCVTVLTNIY